MTTITCPAWCLGHIGNSVCCGASEHLVVGPDYQTTVALQYVRNIKGRTYLDMHFTRPRPEPRRMPRLAGAGLSGGDCRRLGVILLGRFRAMQSCGAAWGDRGMQVLPLLFGAGWRTLDKVTVEDLTGPRGLLLVRLSIITALDLGAPLRPVWDLTGDDCRVLGLRLTQRGEDLEAAR